MLSHVASLLPYVFYEDASPCRFHVPDPLRQCYNNKNLLGFICVYKHVCDKNIDMNWDGYNDYLVQAITRHHPPASVANKIIYNILPVRWGWNPQDEQLLKLLAKYADDKNKGIMIASGYYHLLPNSSMRVDLMWILRAALEVNNVEEVKYILTLTTDLSNLQLYNPITKPIDNRESLALILPYIHTCLQRINSIIVTAYVNNALPDIPIELSNNAHIRALFAHFNNTKLNSTVIDEHIFLLADKFEFSNELFFRCVELAGDSITDMMRVGTPMSYHKKMVCRNVIRDKCLLTICNCSMCEYLCNNKHLYTSK